MKEKLENLLQDAKVVLAAGALALSLYACSTAKPTVSSPAVQYIRDGLIKNNACMQWDKYGAECVYPVPVVVVKF